MPKKTVKNSLKLELDGQVNLVEFHGKNPVRRYPIDSKIVLEALKVALIGGTDLMIAKKAKKR